MDTKDFPLFPKFESLNVYIKPTIPWDKLRNAINSYVEGYVDTNDVLLLVDDTVFGSAQKGFLLTQNHFFAYTDSSKYKSGAISEIDRIEADVGFFKKKLYLGDDTGYWSVEFTQGSKRDIKLLAEYSLQLINVLKEEDESEVEAILEEVIDEDPATNNDSSSEESELYEQQRLMLRRRLDEALALEKETIAEEENLQKTTEIMKPSRYIGVRIDNGNYPEPLYLGEEEQDTDEISLNLTSLSSNQNRLFSFLQNNSDGIIAKLKDSGLALTASALQNDENISRVAGVIYNLLPTPVRFFVNFNTVEKFLLENRVWLINKLK
ncbi:hypothetical protein [Rodentibacter myodis]|uniref:Uncharacterized protein n=1 Tax=Rodentibacter myodis TaxID=1907939 RepID=A0A1V3JKI7_9PAST|nr:hypothetical protein [Rodentibacter myodis]OOF57291.1 hypothetical protein BKL49_09405 [Rodentibacter myodis]